MNELSPIPDLMSPKFLVFGDSQCGKTSILDYYCSKRPCQKIGKTVGCDIHIKELSTTPGESKSLEYVEFWDLDGDNPPMPILHAYIQAMAKDIDSVKGVIFIFDMSNIKTLQNIRKYLDELVVPLLERKRQMETTDDGDVFMPLLVVGTKRELVDDESAAKKLTLIEEYLRWVFGESPKLHCKFMSMAYSYSQFSEFDNFLQAAINGDWENLFRYSPVKRRHPYKMLSCYTKEKLLSLGEDLKKVKAYLFLKGSSFSTYIADLMSPTKLKQETGGLIRDYLDAKCSQLWSGLRR